MPQKILNVSGTNYTPYEAEAQQNVHLGGACVARMVFNSHKVNPTANVPDAESLANQQAIYTELSNRRNISEGTVT